MTEKILELKKLQKEVAQGSMLDVVDYFLDKERTTEETVLMNNLKKDMERLNK